MSSKKIHAGNEWPEQFYYIRRNEDGYLLGGVAQRVRMSQSTPIWRLPGLFDMARRYRAVDTAVEFAERYRIEDYSVVDIAGRVMYDSTNAVCKYGRRGEAVSWR